MNRHTLLFLICMMFAQSCANNSSIFLLEPSSTMSITGKGPGQDATINPYLGNDCTAIVKSLSKNIFQVRIEESDEVVYTITVDPFQEVKIDLNNSQVLYLDALSKPSKSKVSFSK